MINNHTAGAWKLGWPSFGQDNPADRGTVADYHRLVRERGYLIRSNVNRRIEGSPLLAVPAAPIWEGRVA